MNRTIIERLNSLVKTTTSCTFSDFCIGPKQGQWGYAARFDARRYFAVPGNYDKDTRKLTQEFSWLAIWRRSQSWPTDSLLSIYAMRV